MTDYDKAFFKLMKESILAVASFDFLHAVLTADSDFLNEAGKNFCCTPSNTMRKTTPIG